MGEMFGRLDFGVDFFGETSLLTGADDGADEVALIDGIDFVDLRCTGGLFFTVSFHILVRLCCLPTYECYRGIIKT